MAILLYCCKNIMSNNLLSIPRKKNREATMNLDLSQARADSITNKKDSSSARPIIDATAST